TSMTLTNTASVSTLSRQLHAQVHPRSTPSLHRPPTMLTKTTTTLFHHSRSNHMTSSELDLPLSSSLPTSVLFGSRHDATSPTLTSSRSRDARHSALFALPPLTAPLDIALAAATELLVVASPLPAHFPIAGGSGSNGLRRVSSSHVSKNSQ